MAGMGDLFTRFAMAPRRAPPDTGAGTSRRLDRRAFLGCALCAAALAVRPARAEQIVPGVDRLFLKRIDYPDERHVIVLAEVDYGPGALLPRHIHPGVESSYMAAGFGTLAMDGHADLLVSARQGFQVPAALPHSFRAGVEGARIVANYVVEKDKPLSTWVP